MSLPEYIVACTLFAEARSDGREGMLDVASVVVTISAELKLTPDAVCLSPVKFSCWSDPQHPACMRDAMREAAQNPDLWNEARSIAITVCNGTFKRRGDWTHFVARRRVDSGDAPAWFNDSFVPRGRHYFGRAD